MNSKRIADKPHKCLLCGTDDKLSVFFKNEFGVIFLLCDCCGFIFKSTEFHLSLEAQQKRYGFHQNQVDDPDYQNFLSPVVEAVLSQQKPEDLGLDFGCGPASVIKYLLEKKNYRCEIYDPLFFSNSNLLNKTYDYITCTEVIEHFCDPHTEFIKLRKLLKTDGRFFIKTGLIDSVNDFPNWYYHRDPTHVGFFGKKSLEFVCRQFGFSDLKVFDQYLILQG